MTSLLFLPTVPALRHMFVTFALVLNYKVKLEL
jgi:hypothetical protein